MGKSDNYPLDAAARAAGGGIKVETTLTWKSISERPKRSGSVLIALKHNGVNVVLMGFYNRHTDRFSESTYNGLGNTQYQYWAEAKHPEGDIFGDM